MFCTRCGIKLIDGARFCQACGAPVVMISVPASPVNPQPVPPPAAFSVPPYPIYPAPGFPGGYPPGQPNYPPTQQPFPCYPPMPPRIGYPPYSQGYCFPRMQLMVYGPAPHEGWEPAPPAGKKGSWVVPVFSMVALSIVGIALFFVL